MNGTEHEILIQSIIENPHDDNFRLVFADYLEEQGDPRAEIIRLQLEMAALPRRAKRRTTLRRKELNLLRSHGGFLDEPHSCKVLGYHGGFVSDIEITIPRFLKYQDELFARAPITHVTLKGGPTKLPQVAKSNYLDRLSSLEFASSKAKCSDIAKVIAAPKLSNLKSLRAVMWHDVEHMKEIHAAIADASHLTIESLEITCSGTLKVFQHAEHLQGLKQFSHSWAYGSDAPGNDEIVENLCNYPVFHNLEEIELFGMGLTRHGVQRLFESPIGSNLHRFVINNAGDVRGWDAEFPALTDLSLQHCTQPAFLQAISKQPQLTSLDCTGGRVGDEGAEALAESPLLSQLQRIVLTNNQLTFAGVKRLAESPHRKRGQKFYLRSNRLSVKEVKRIQTDFGASFGNLGKPMEYRYLTW